MRILQVIPYFTPKKGGSVSVAFDLSIELARKGHDVTVITSDLEYDQEYANIAQCEGVRVVKFHCWANLGMFLITDDMKNWLDEELKNYDIVHLHNFRSYQNVVARRYAKKHDVPYILQAHGSVPMFREKNLLKKFYDTTWGKKILKEACLLVAVTEMEAEQLRQAGVEDERIVIIPNGIHTERYSQLSVSGSFKKMHNIENHRIVLYLGRIQKEKRIDMLIRSFSLIENRTGDVVLVIAGPDEGHRKELEAMVRKLHLEDRVIFTGFTESVTDAYLDADLLVNPRPNEIFGLVPFEAILSGTPVVVSEDSGCSKIIKEVGCGYVTNTLDELQLANTIAGALGNPAEGTTLVRRGREFVKKNLDWKHIAGRFEEVYVGCIQDSGDS